MTLADLITQPVSYETARDLAIILTPEQAATLGAIQAQYGDPRHVASPVPLTDGRLVRYRTVGDMTCTAAVESTASNIDDIITEIIATKTSERGETRIDDKVSEAAMEDRKKSGYF